MDKTPSIFYYLVNILFRHRAIEKARMMNLSVGLLFVGVLVMRVKISFACRMCFICRITSPRTLDFKPFYDGFV